MRSLIGIGSLVAASLGVSLGGYETRPAYRPSTNKVEHFETPKPLTKRQKRRRRGKDQEKING